MKRTFARLLTTAALLLLAAPASARPSSPLQGTWTGTQEGLRFGAVTLHFDDERVVAVDAADVMVGRVTWKLQGPGTKDGRLTLQVDVTVSGMFDGAGRVKRTTGRGKRVGTAAVKDDELRLCWAESGDPKLRPSWTGTRGQGSKSARCFDLRRVATADLTASPGSPPRVGPPDGSAPNPPPDFREPGDSGRECMASCQKRLAPTALSRHTIDERCGKTCGVTPVATSVDAAQRCVSDCREANRGSALSAKAIDERCQTSCYALPMSPPPTDFECMRECRQHNQARAVSAEQIDADCRKTCAVK